MLCSIIGVNNHLETMMDAPENGTFIAEESILPKFHALNVNFHAPAAKSIHPFDKALVVFRRTPFFCRGTRI